MKSISLCLILFSFNLLATEIISLKTVEAEAIKLSEKYGPENVLVVLDIDNTILTMPRQFASDQWFSWQSKNCFNKKFNKDICVASNFSDLLKVQGKLFALTNMVPTEINTAAIIKNLQSKGFKVISLTSRGPKFRDSTQRELKRNGIYLEKNAIGPKNGYPATYLPYDLSAPTKYGLTKNETLKKARYVSYMNGIYMTAGQNKGIMLRNLLAKTKTNFKAIVFADDHKKHIQKMNQAFSKLSQVELKAFRYGGVDNRVKQFKKDPVLYSRKGAAYYNAVKAGLNKTL